VNREIFPGGIYPLAGDVTSTAGNATVTVTGIQGITVTPGFFQGGEVLEYSAATHSWTPILRAAIQVNGLTVSDDYLISVNVPKEVLVNGV
jgi:hypothetical protein